ncbi:MAG TPA: DNA repair exonuclease, partial [Acidimicrobiales bacterium]|nr:DNA repair exonuclease [Acidimicrobiales bacterium]
MEESFRIPDFSFVHAADLHLDTPFKGIGSTAPYVAEQLREASLAAFDALVDLCLQRKAAFLLIAGDIYDGPERGLRAQLRFRDGLARLSAAGISSFVVHGNHDPVETGWSALGGPWPERVTVFASGTVQAVPVEVDGVPVATVQGVSFAQRSERENLALRFAHAAGPGVQVGVLHCNVRGAASGYDDYSPCTLDDLRSVGLDYWALGHIHSRMILSGQRDSDDPWIVYPGNLQARSPKPSERGLKGAMVVHVRGGRIADVETVGCDVVRFDLLEQDVASIADLADLRSRLASAARDRLALADGRSLVLRCQLAGQGELHM